MMLFAAADDAGFQMTSFCVVLWCPHNVLGMSFKSSYLIREFANTVGLLMLVWLSLTFGLCFSGDEIVGATINFDQLSKQEVLEVLKLMEPFDDNMRVLTRTNLSKSVGNLDLCSKSPETVGDRSKYE